MTTRAAALERAKHWGPLWLGGVLVVVIIGGLAVLPARTWMSQRTATAQAESQLHQVNGRIAELEAQLTLLQTDAEVERMARENFDLVKPGEESYRILPAPTQD
ncbi:MAG: septum formation initiator family protein [Acidimicrobiales bacterium]